MTKNEFLNIVRSEQPNVLARRFLGAPEVAAFPDAVEYVSFQTRVANAVADLETVVLAGSGNWGFSLHPEKAFAEFHARSDLDVVAVSSRQFNQLWEEMRRQHRTLYFRLSDYERKTLRRNGENVYAGFVSPLWLPDDRAPMRLRYTRIFDRLSDRSVGYRRVRMYFFKNEDEAVAYYERGFAIARRVLT